MNKLLAYLNGLHPTEQRAYVERCHTTVGYLRKAISRKQRLSEGLTLRLAAESGGGVVPSDILPDVDWVQMRRALIDVSMSAHSRSVPPPATGVTGNAQAELPGGVHA